MGVFVLPSSAFGVLLPHFPVVSLGTPRGQFHLVLGSSSNRKRKNLLTGNWQCRPRIVAASNRDNSKDNVTDDEDGSLLGSYEMLEMKEDELVEARRALSEVKARQAALEKEREQLLEDFASSEAKQKEYVASVLHDKELAVSELESTKSLFHQKLQESVKEKFALESKLVLARQDAVELAVQVEKLAEVAFRQATSHILEDAKLRISAAETLAAESAFQIDEQIRKSTEGTIFSIIEESKDAINKALDVAENAIDEATQAVAVFTDAVNPIDVIASAQSENIKLQGAVSDLEAQLLVSESELDRLKLELQQAQVQANAAELRSSNAEKALLEFQELSRKKALEQEEEIRSLLEKIKKEAVERKKALSKAFKAELESIKAAVDASKEITCSRDNAYMRRCEALQRSLRTSESALKMWRQRAEMAQSLLLKERSEKEDDEDVIYIANGGRIDLLTDDDSQKWKLLSYGPRKEIPQWMARRIRSIRPKFPPRKTDISKALNSSFKSLELPKLDEVWSIAQEKLREGDMLTEHVIEKEVIEKKRKALERALQRKTVKWKRIPEETKIEPGTGTGREIVFQGFNWESWRRQWYQELAFKAADLSHSGITAVWLPPPTQSVAPQGYMPSDLYNLNSSYGSVEDLKSCIEEMHSQELLALGDIVLNHRCAHKQSPNGVWNIFGGKLAWGPEAIVCDDPNFQGRGNPSSVQLNKFDYRLANKLDTDLQKLRCRVNYHALKFADPILEMGKTLVHRMRMRSKRYIALHLRFEPDMLAFSGCDYGGGEKERNELGAIRKRWKTLHKNNPDKQRRQGKCPLTPEEVGLMLRALGYGSDVHIYVASGEVYGGEETLRPLKSLFPNFYSKDTIATKEELAPFSSFSSRMAALDFIVCDESDVFVTNNNGNMARILAGRRKYFGHKPTIRPNAKKLYRLFLSRSNMTWEAFASRVRIFQRGFMGEPKEVRPGRGEFHENPSACICEDSEAREKATAYSRGKKNGKLDDSSRKKEVMVSDDQNDYDDNDEPRWPDLDDDENQVWPQEKLHYNGTGSDYDAVISDEPELEEMLSD